ncbi:MAG: hypothetical protein AUH15_04905 [Acidobacteriales bacterium 13_2_20CM_55_8]|nr:MAG: hypothetical protein AUH15_04905 [Acidobacteriales bacterium 13_2_20CM_55_8]
MTPPAAKKGHRPTPHVLEGKLRKKLQQEATRKLAANQVIALGAHGHAGKQPDGNISDPAAGAVIQSRRQLRLQLRAPASMVAGL